MAPWFAHSSIFVLVIYVTECSVSNCGTEGECMPKTSSTRGISAIQRGHHLGRLHDQVVPHKSSAPFSESSTHLIQKSTKTNSTKLLLVEDSLQLASIGSRSDVDQSSHEWDHAELCMNIGTIVTIAVILWRSSHMARKRKRKTDRAVEMNRKEGFHRIASAPNPKRTLTRPSLGELIFPPAALDSYMSNILAGLIVGVKLTLGMVVFANIACNSSDSPEIRSEFSTVINANLMTTIIGIVLSVCLSDMNLINAPQDIPAFLIADVAVRLNEVLPDKSQLAPTFLAIVWSNTIIFGVVAWLMGKFGLGTLFKLVPSPVVGGFIASTGALGLRGGLQMVSGVKFRVFWPTDLEPFSSNVVCAHIACGLGSLVCIRYLGNWVKPHFQNQTVKSLLGPFCLLSPVFLFYLVLVCRFNVSEDLSTLRSMQWVYPTRPTDWFYKLWGQVFKFSSINFDAVLGDSQIVGTLCTRMLLSLLSTVLNTLGAGGALEQPMNLDDELRRIGIMNIFAGAAGGNIVYPQMGMSVNMRIDGGTHRIAMVVGAGLVSVLFLGGIPISPYIPRFFLAGVFLNLGLTFIKMYLIDQYSNMDAASYESMVLVVVLALWKDLTWSVGLGLVILNLSMLLSLFHHSPFSFASSHYMSRRRWSKEQREEFRRAHTQYEIVKLHGPTFFGNITHISEPLDELLSFEPMPQHVILDIENLTSMDESVADFFEKVAKKFKKNGGESLTFSGNKSLHWFLVLNELIADKGKPMEGKPFKWFPSLDDALYEVEAIVLNSNNKLNSGLQNRRQHGELSLEDARVLVSMTEDDWTVLVKMGEMLELEHGAVVFTVSDVCDATYIVLNGEIKLQAIGMLGNVHSRKICAPSLVGCLGLSIGLSEHTTEAKVVSELGARLLKLKTSTLQAMKEDHPKAYMSYLENIAIPDLSASQTEVWA